MSNSIHCSLHTTTRVSISPKNLSVWIISKSQRYTSAQASGFYESQTWGALDKAWLGYVITKIRQKMTSKFIMHPVYKNYKEKSD